MRNFLSYIAPFRKAIVGGLASLVLVFLAKYGVNSDMSVGDAVNLLANGIVSGGLVWLTRNGK